MVNEAEQMKGIADALDKIATAFASFKKEHTREMEERDAAVAEMKRDLDAVLRKTSRPGANVEAPAEGDPIDARAMRTKADFEKRYGWQAAGTEYDVTLADFARGVAGIRTTEGVKASLAVGTNTDGGYAVPDILMPSILSALVPESSLLSAGAAFMPLDQGAKSARVVATATLPTAAWRQELGAIAESQPTFRAVDAIPRSLACIVRISRELLADALNMDQALRLAIGQAFAKEIDRVGLRGSGTAPEPRGLLNTVGINAVTQGANGAVLANYAPILAAMQAIRNENGPMPTAAIMAPRSTFKLAGLLDTTGQPIQKPEMVQRLKLLDTSQIPVNLTVGTSSDCSELYIGDFTRMYFLIRENVSIQLMREHFSTTGELGFLCHARLDVVVPYPKAFAVVTGVRA